MTTSRKIAAAFLSLAIAAGTVCLFQDGVRAPATARQGQEAETQHARVHELSLPRGAAESFDRDVFRRYAKANGAAFDLDDELRLGDEIRMTLFETLRLSLVVERQMKSTGRHRVFLASSGGGDGAHAVILQKRDGVIVHVTDDATASNFILGLHRHLTWVGEYGGRLVPIRCGNGADAPLTRDQIPRNLPPAEKLADGSVVVDVLVAQDVHAAKFASRQGMTHEEFAELTLQQANLVLERSGLLDEFSFRLVHSVVLGGSLGDDLSRALQHVSAGIPLNGIDLRTSIHLARDRHGADVAVALMDGSSGSMAGISQGLGGYAYLRNAGSERAHCVCDMRAAMGYTLAHELGHILGAGHSDQQEIYQGPQLFEFSAGCYGGDWHSVMAYAKEGHLRPIGRFSSPELSGDDGHDNVQTLRLTYARVSNYRRARDAASVPVARGPANPVPDLVASASAAAGGAVIASVPKTARAAGGAILSADGEMEDEAPENTRRRTGRPTVTLEQFRQFVQGAAKKLDAKPIVAGVPRGSVLNIDTKLVAREFQNSHPEVVEVLTDFLPDGVSLEQLSSGRIVPEDRRDPSARKSGLVLKVDEDGILSGKFRLIFRDAEGKSSVDVKVIGRVMEGESAGVASIDGDDAGPWYVTIAPDETAGEDGQETPPASGTEPGAKDR